MAKGLQGASGELAFPSIHALCYECSSLGHQMKPEGMNKKRGCKRIEVWPPIACSIQITLSSTFPQQVLLCPDFAGKKTKTEEECGREIIILERSKQDGDWKQPLRFSILVSRKSRELNRLQMGGTTVGAKLSLSGTRGKGGVDLDPRKPSGNSD